MGLFWILMRLKPDGFLLKMMMSGPESNPRNWALDGVLKPLLIDGQPWKRCNFFHQAVNKGVCGWRRIAMKRFAEVYANPGSPAGGCIIDADGDEGKL